METLAGRAPAQEAPARTVAAVGTGEVGSDEALLIDRVRAGDPSAYGELYRRHEDAVASLARRLTRDRHEADDVVSEVFCNALRALQNGSGPTDALLPYLQRSVRNTIIKSRTRGDSGRAVTSPSERLERADELDPFRAPGAAVSAFQSVSERHQQVLWSVEVEGTPSAEIARAEEMTAPAAASLAYRARCALRRAYVAASLGRPTALECRPFQANIPSFVDGGLGAKKVAKLEAHCAECAECADALDRARSLRSRLSDRAWWAVVPLGAKALIVRAGQTIVGTVAAAPVATTAVVAGAVVAGAGALVMVESDASGGSAAPTDPVVAVADPSTAAWWAAPVDVADPDLDPDAAASASQVDGSDTVPSVPEAGAVADVVSVDVTSPSLDAPVVVDATGLGVIADADLAAVLTESTTTDADSDADGAVGDGPDAGEAAPDAEADHGADPGVDPSVVSPVLDDVTSLLDPVDPLLATLTGAVEPVVEAVVDPVVELLDPVVGAVVDPVVEIVDPVVETVDPVVESVVEIVDPVVETVDPVVETVDPVVDSVVDDVVDPVVDAVDDVVDDVVTGAGDPAGDTVTGVVDDLLGGGLFGS